jgi:hypothetical protein
MTDGYRDFEFDLPGALLDHLVTVLDGMEVAPLNVGGVAGIPDAQGVYQLFLDGRLVYIGKTDAESGLRRRLERHAEKVLHRAELAPELMSFKAVRVFVFTAMDLETQLIKHYAGKDGATAWNNSGFGSNDPGRNRDRTVIKGKNFDALHPINIDRTLDGDFSGTRTAAALALLLKDSLPYTFRFETYPTKSRKPHPSLMDTTVEISSEARTARALITELTRQLPSGWQSTAFRSHVILYKEHVDDYPDAEILARS